VGWACGLGLWAGPVGWGQALATMVAVRS